MTYTIGSSVKHTFLSELTQAMAAFGFREVAMTSNVVPNVELLLKRQTWNTNRAIVVVAPPEMPSEFGGYLRELRKRVAFRCGFIPFFWGIGIQVIAVVPGLARSNLDPAKHVARVDNQWAIVQSLFLVDPSARVFRSARSWGQVVTGRFQDAIAGVLEHRFQPQNP